MQKCIKHCKKRALEAIPGPFLFLTFGQGREDAALGKSYLFGKALTEAFFIRLLF